MVAEQEYVADEKKMKALFGGGASAAASRYGVRPISVERQSMSLTWQSQFLLQAFAKS
jgi:hypothetical protein